MAKKKKIKLVVVFGTEACNYALNYSIKGAIRKIKNGSIDCLSGMYAKYELDTEADVAVLKQALNDAYGWNESYWEE